MSWGVELGEVPFNFPSRKHPEISRFALSPRKKKLMGTVSALARLPQSLNEMKDCLNQVVNVKQASTHR